MDGEREGRRLLDFLLGGVVGASAALAAARRRERQTERRAPTGLAAFEEAPCYRETLEKKPGVSQH